MRPQHITAENTLTENEDRLHAAGFNEAAAYHCGKRMRSTGTWMPSRPGFNEAAAYHCGKRAPRYRGTE